jgi:hypothetical protein
MNKKLMLAAGLMTLISSFAYAGSCSSSASSCNNTSEVAQLSGDEASFVSKLSQNHSIAFNEMNAEERQEVLRSAEKENLTPDAAVDQFTNAHQSATEAQ